MMEEIKAFGKWYKAQPKRVKAKVLLALAPMVVLVGLTGIGEWADDMATKLGRWARKTKQKPMLLIEKI